MKGLFIHRLGKQALELAHFFVGGAMDEEPGGFLGAGSGDSQTEDC